MRLFFIVATMIAMFCPSTAAFAGEPSVAKSPLEASRIILGGYVGVGNAEVDLIWRLSADLDPSVGGFGQLELPLGRNFLIGGRVGAHTFKLAVNDSAIGIPWAAVVPKLRFPIGESAELNLSVAIGFDEFDLVWHVSAGPVFYLDGFMLGLDAGVLTGSVQSTLGPVWHYKMVTLTLSVLFPL
jgi:hypothetical protein